MKHVRLGDMLVSQNIITEEQLQEAIRLQKEQNKRLGEALVDNGFITDQQLMDTLRIQLGIDYVDLAKVDIDPAMSKLIPKSLAKKNQIVPVRVSRDSLFLAMADPMNFMAVEAAHNTSKKRIIPMIAARKAVDHAIEVLYGNEGAAEAMAQMRAEANFTEEEITVAQPENGSTEDAPTIRLVNSIIERAVLERASDIHFEPTAGDMAVRMRIDGRLQRIMAIPKDIKDSVISRLKVMARMNIVEKRIPQDGGAILRLRERDVDMRLSTLPTIYGEKMVIRVLGVQETVLNRAGIGIPEAENRKLDKMLANTSGVILIVGPTGSGKSSTMYTLLQELLNEHTNLITLEDPVEYRINGAVQVQINEKVGLTFASGLRSILRQDPDVICVGEIRDGETAEVAMRAAITGHLVISTIHTEDAVSAIDRLRDMGVAPYLVAAGLRGVISQRLLRRVCPNCKETYQPDASTIEFSKIQDRPGRIYYRGRGCDQCFHEGYRGRIGVFEVMLMNEELRHCINTGGDLQELSELAAKTGYVTMLEHADDLVDEGITTVEEIIRTLNFGD